MASLFKPTQLQQICRIATRTRPIALSSRPAVIQPLRSSIFTLSHNQPRTQLQALRPAIASKAAFQTSAKRDILPPLPQKVEGTTNDPTPVPEPHPSHGSYHWSFERVVAAALVPVTAAPFISGTLNPTLDATLCALIIIHSHTGFESMIIDYLPKWRVPFWRALVWWGFRVGTLVVAAGLYEFETNDVGLTAAIKRIWHA